MNLIIQESNNPDLLNTKLGSWLMTISTLLSFGLVLIRLACYVKIYQELYANDKKLGSKVLSKKTLNIRRKKNAITLYGQVISFGIEIIGAIVIFTVRLSFDIVDETFLTFFSIFISACLSFSNVCFSAELRRHYFKGFFAEDSIFVRWGGPEKAETIIHLYVSCLYTFYEKPHQTLIFPHIVQFSLSINVRFRNPRSSNSLFSRVKFALKLHIGKCNKRKISISTHAT